MSSKEVILIIGGDSSIGRYLADKLESSAKKVWRTTRRNNTGSEQYLYLDLSSDISLFELPQEKIDVAVFCAAITSKEQCFLEPELTRRVNVENTLALASRLMKNGTFVIFLSTNAVFDGSYPFVKVDDTVNPITEYGKQKAKVEKQIVALGKNLAIIRLSKVMSPNNILFQHWIRDLMNNKNITPFSDMYFSPISIDIAINVICIVINSKLKGIFHAPAKENISYAEAAYFIAKMINADNSLIHPISMKDAGYSYPVQYHNTLENSFCLHEIEVLGISSLFSLIKK